MSQVKQVEIDIHHWLRFTKTTASAFNQVTISVYCSPKMTIENARNMA